MEIFQELYFILVNLSKNVDMKTPQNVREMACYVHFCKTIERSFNRKKFEQRKNWREEV